MKNVNRVNCSPFCLVLVADGCLVGHSREIKGNASHGAKLINEIWFHEMWLRATIFFLKEGKLRPFLR